MRGPLAIIAGGGDYPPRLAGIAAGAGRRRSSSRRSKVRPIRWPSARPIVQSYRLGQLGRLLDELRRREISDIVMIGGLPRPSFGALRPEASTLKYLPHFARAFQGGDDHLLRGVVRFFEEQGFRVHGPAEIAPELTAPLGPLGRQGAASPPRRTCIAHGFSLLAALSPFDVGQAAILADHRVIAIEAAEGTDAMIRRVADLVAARSAQARQGRRRSGQGAQGRPGSARRHAGDRPETLRNVAEAGLVRHRR